MITIKYRAYKDGHEYGIFSHESDAINAQIDEFIDYYEPFEYEPPVPTQEEILQSQIAEANAIRNSLLSATDWYAIRASEPGGKPIPPEILEYRQALRDIDQQPGWPTDVSWPVRQSQQSE